MKSIPASSVWMPEVARAMIHEKISFAEAVRKLGYPFTRDEIPFVENRPEFKQFLLAEKNKIRAAYANDPSRSKASAVGLLIECIENLVLEGEHEKAVVAIEKLAKIEGWSGPEQSINIISGMSAKDIEREKERLLKELGAIKPPTSPQEPLAN